MEFSKENLQQKKNEKETEDLKIIEKRINNNPENTQIVEIEPRLPKITPKDLKKISFDERVEAKANELKEEIFRLHREGKSVREIGEIMNMSREMARNIINGKGSLKILARQRI